MSNAAQRVITGLVGATVLVWSAWFGGWVLGGMVLLIAMLGQWEWYALLRNLGMQAWRFSGLAIGFILAVHPLLPGGVRPAMVLLVLLLVWMPFSKRTEPVHAFCATVSGALYPAALLSFLLYLRTLEPGTEGFELLVSVFVMVWVSDSSAQIIGSRFGRHKLAPITSPNKTWEGYFAGIVGPVVVAVIYHLTVGSSLGLLHGTAVATVCGVASASGDLAQSRFKRAANMSSTGKVLPGHGGILDRFDSMVVAAPLAYLYLWLVGWAG